MTDNHDSLLESNQEPDDAEATPRRVVSLADMLDLLSRGTIELQGLMPWSSNYTFLVAVQADDVGTYAIYKPRQGERPLWDFPAGTLCQREVAAFVISEALGWSLVPPTVLRDGPHGLGSVQFYIDADHEQHYFTLRDNHTEAFQRMALFDVIINNADRKGGHCLIDADGHIWAVDHGIALHEEEKLRTVIWEWAGQPIPQELLSDVERLRERLSQEDGLCEMLHELLLPRELSALERRVERILARPLYPLPGPGRSVPWPTI